MGTSIMAVSFKGGVILGADSRTSNGSYIANRVTDKITPLADKVYILRSGSAADTQAIAGYVQLYIAQHQAELGEQVAVKVAANLASQMAYTNKDNLQVGRVRVARVIMHQPPAEEQVSDTTSPARICVHAAL